MKRVLIVDDEDSVRTVLCTFLQRRGYDVAEAENGPLALIRFVAFRPHLVLLDLRMPGMNGIEVLQKLRDLDHSLPVIMVTGVEDEDTARESIRLGACDYIKKPFSYEQLDTHLAVHLMMAE
jgi:DNA-binding response OmpR family regulator